MSKLVKFYERLVELDDGMVDILYDGIDVSVDWVMKGTDIEQIQLCIYDGKNGVFIIDDDGHESFDKEFDKLFLLYVNDDEKQYHKPVEFYANMDIKEFIEYCLKVRDTPPRKTTLHHSMEMDFYFAVNIDEVLWKLNWFRNDYKDCHILCDVPEGSNQFLQCRAYRIENDEEYNARLLVEHEKAENHRLNAKDKEELQRLNDRDTILKELEQLENHKKELYDKLESL
jgi:hypothetical protein